MSRHPYTNACDYLRMNGPRNGISPLLSRADASKLQLAVAKALGVSEEYLATKLSDYYMEREKALTDEWIEGSMITMANKS